MMNGWYGAAGMGGWIVMLLVFLLFWGSVVSLVVYGLRRGFPDRTRDPRWSAYEEADRILCERFARGDIDEDELLKRRAALRRTM